MQSQLMEIGASGLVPIDTATIPEGLQRGAIVTHDGTYGNWYVEAGRGIVLEVAEEVGVSGRAVRVAWPGHKTVKNYVVHDMTGREWTIHTDKATEEQTAQLARICEAADAEEARQRQAEQQEADRRREEGRELLKQHAPTWAKAAIVACYATDKSEPMTDYYNVVEETKFILAWSKHTRDIFSEMRKACASSGVEEVAHFITAPTVDGNGRPRDEDNKSWWHPVDEHREKYSMGSGYYLKDERTYGSGWVVRKIELNRYRQDELGLCILDGGLKVAKEPTRAPRAAAPVAASDVAGLFSLHETVHAKKGHQVYVAQLVERVPREEYQAHLARAKSLGGYYSTYRSQGAVPGFQFKEESKRAEFVGGSVGPDSPETRRPTSNADKLRESATKARDKATEKLNQDRQTNTPRRMRIAEGIESECRGIIRRAEAALSIADAQEAGTGGVLDTVRTMPDVEALDYANKHNRSIEDSRARRLGFDTPATLAEALEAYKLHLPDAVKPDPIKELERSIQFAKIPGFFQTPADLAARMVDEADVGEGHTVLEPSAGAGRIADAAKEAGATVTCCEVNRTLQEILLRKGHTMLGHDDFMQVPRTNSFDAVIMNPPFEKGADVQHVRHAWGHVKPGGRIVAIMGEGVFFRNDSASTDFRAWLDEVGYSEPLPAGTFKESGTGVNTRLVVIDKPDA